MSELERHLTALRDHVSFPATPDLVSGLRLEPPPRRSLRWAAVALAVAAGVVAGALALSPGARSAFLELFRLQGATVTRIESLPPVERTSLDLGERVDREEAERRAGFRLVDLGEPDSIHVRSNRIVSLVYGAPNQPRLVLSQFRGGEVWEGFHRKVGGSGTRVEQVVVDGSPGLFVSGAEHFVLFVDETGRVTDEPTALAGTTLLWERGALLLRLEADLSREEAVALAEAVG